MTLEAGHWPPGSVWFSRPAVLHRWTYVVIGVAVAVESILNVFGAAHAVSLLGLTVTAAGAVLAWQRPWPGLAVADVGTVLAAFIDKNPIGPWTITVFVLFSFALRHRAVLGTAATAIALYLALVVVAHNNFVDLVAFTAVVTALYFGAVGTALRIHQQYWQALEQHAADAVATRDSEASRQVAQERLRIARDLHDVLGHQIAVVNMQLGVAEVRLPADAGPARAAIESARLAVRSVLGETQRILQVLRRDTGDPEDAEDAGQPAPELSRLPELIDSYRAIGLRVSASLGAVPAGIDPAVALTAFRIVQEALTNAHRHGTGSAELSVTAEHGRVLINVVNPRRPGRTGASQGTGYGLLGVRERVTSAGGRLTVTDAEADRFGVRVALAIDGSDLT